MYASNKKSNIKTLKYKLLNFVTDNILTLKYELLNFCVTDDSFITYEKSKQVWPEVYKI